MIQVYLRLMYFFFTFIDPNTSEKDATEYAYLQQLAESISRSELCTSIKASSII